MPLILLDLTLYFVLLLLDHERKESHDNKSK